MILVDILSDGIFAAVAAIGFGAISDPPKRAFASIAILAAIGHALRFSLMKYFGVDIATASLAASFSIGIVSVYLGQLTHCPMTVLYIPALLPMIPGMFAYRTVFSMIMFMQSLKVPELQEKYLMTMVTNGVLTISIIFMLALGATMPMFISTKRTYSMTRNHIINVNGKN